MTNQYFRAGAGTVLYREDGTIAIFQRANLPEVWQLQQGGCDHDETVEDTLWRELYEETALTQAHITSVTPYPTWLPYPYPDAMRSQLRDPNCLGQIHRWYFLKLAPETVIDVTQAADKEFLACRFTTWTDLLAAQVPPHDIKKVVYQTLANYFATTIMDTQTHRTA